MPTGFFVRVTAVCDRVSRQAARLSDDARVGGMVATASMARTVSDVLARLAFDAAKDDGQVSMTRVSEETGDCCRALRQIARDLDLLDEVLVKIAQTAAAELSKLSRDSMSQTQPIE